MVFRDKSVPTADTSIRAIAAALALKRFTVTQLCEHTGLRPPQVYSVLSELKREGFLKSSAEPNEPGARPAHRPAELYVVVDEPAKIQALASRVYRLRRAIDPKESESTDLTAIATSLTSLEILLDVCSSAANSKPLSRAQLESVERELHTVYRLLESATYRRAINIREPEGRNHPIAAIWERWQLCSDGLGRVLEDWRGNAQSRPAFQKLAVATDPRFIDSSLFLWLLLERQVLRRDGFAVECEPMLCEWREVPFKLASRPYSVGFYNRRLPSEQTTNEVGYWEDLCAYRGYGLLAHPGLGLNQRPPTLVESKQFLESFIRFWRSQEIDPTIISIGSDTSWRFGDHLAPGIPREEFSIQTIANANEALHMFRQQPQSLFVGGLPQRLQAEAEGFIPVIDADHKPTLFSFNGLHYNAALRQANQPLLQAIATAWFETVTRLKADEPFRREVAASTRKMLRNLRADQAVEFDDEMFDAIFTSERFEIFPENPAEMTQIAADLQIKAVRQNLRAPAGEPPKPAREIEQMLDQTGNEISQAFTPPTVH